MRHALVFCINYTFFVALHCCCCCCLFIYVSCWSTKSIKCGNNRMRHTRRILSEYPFFRIPYSYSSLFLMDAQTIDKYIFIVPLNDAKHKWAHIFCIHTHTQNWRRSSALVPRCVINTFKISQKSRGATNVGCLLRCVSFVRHFLIVSWVCV